MIRAWNRAALTLGPGIFLAFLIGAFLVTTIYVWTWPPNSQDDQGNMSFSLKKS